MPGFSVQIVPLTFTSAREMVRLVEPFAKDAQAVRADDIASRLQLSLPETQLLLKVMTDMGVIESSVDSHLALITRKGLHHLQSSRPATV